MRKRGLRHFDGRRKAGLQRRTDLLCERFARIFDRGAVGDEHRLALGCRRERLKYVYARRDTRPYLDLGNGDQAVLVVERRLINHDDFLPLNDTIE